MRQNTVLYRATLFHVLKNGSKTYIYKGQNNKRHNNNKGQNKWLKIKVY